MVSSRYRRSVTTSVTPFGNRSTP